MGDGPWGEANGGRKTEKRSYSCSLLGGWKALQGLGDAGKQLRVGERDRKEKEMPGRTMTGLNSNAVCAQAGSTRIALGGSAHSVCPRPRRRSGRGLASSKPALQVTLLLGHLPARCSQILQDTAGGWGRGLLSIFRLANRTQCSLEERSSLPLNP